jgi:hypothetical protein
MREGSRQSPVGLQQALEELLLAQEKHLHSLKEVARQ